MPSSALLRSIATGLLFCFGLMAWTGCGGETAPFVPKTEYSPESLAVELGFRYKSMTPVSRPKPVTSPRNREPEGTAEKVQAKSKATTKAERAVTLEDLVDEVVTKAREIPGKSPDEVLKKVAELVEKDETIKATDRHLMAERLLQSK